MLTILRNETELVLATKRVNFIFFYERQGINTAGDASGFYKNILYTMNIFRCSDGCDIIQ